jgi:hypothetical protein
MLRTILALDRQKITREWRKLNNEELHNLYSSTAIRLFKSRTMRLTGLIVHGDVRMHSKLCAGFWSPSTHEWL